MEHVNYYNLLYAIHHFEATHIINFSKKFVFPKFSLIKLALFLKYNTISSIFWQIHYPTCITDGSKHHKKELVYLPCSDEQWIVDVLRARNRPSETPPQLSDVLKRSEAFERGDGLLPVRSPLADILKHLPLN